MFTWNIGEYQFEIYNETQNQNWGEGEGLHNMCDIVIILSQIQ